MKNKKKNLNVIQNSSPWYQEGLAFQCTGCGQCCTGAPGYVWVNDQEIQEIATYLNLTLEDFARKYLRKAQGRFSLIELPKTYDCIFLKGNKCEIYPVRPIQCRTFPWWPQHLISEQAWKEAARYCEGITSSAPIVPLDTIEEQKTLQEKTTGQGA